MDSRGKVAVYDTKGEKAAEPVYRGPAVEEHTAYQRYWNEGVDWTEQPVGCEATDQTTWQFVDIHDQKDGQRGRR